jgi:hypothetical protein
LQDDSVVLEKGRYEGVTGSADCYVLTFRITAQTLYDAAKHIVGQMKQDAQLEAIWEEWIEEKVLPSDAPTYGEMVEQLEQLLENVKTELEHREIRWDKTLCTVTDFVSANNRILGKKWEFEQGTLSYFGNNRFIDFSLKTEGFSANLAGTVDRREESVTFNGAILMENKQLVELSGKVSEKEVSYRLEMGEDLRSYLESATGESFGDYAAYLKGYVEFTATTKKESSSSRISLGFDQEEWLGIAMESRMRKVGEIALPEESKCVEDAQLWMNSFDMEKLEKKLKELGIPMETEPVL